MIIEGHKGFQYRIASNPYLSTLNGYVLVPEGHPWYGVHYNDPTLEDVEVHGGLTYSGDGLGAWAETYRFPLPKGYWLLGFDTGHWTDAKPGMEELNLNPHATFKDADYVREHCKSLCEQALSADTKDDE